MIEFQNCMLVLFIACIMSALFASFLGHRSGVKDGREQARKEYEENQKRNTSVELAAMFIKNLAVFLEENNFDLASIIMTNDEDDESEQDSEDREGYNGSDVNSSAYNHNRDKDAPSTLNAGMAENFTLTDYQEMNDALELSKL